MYRDLGDYTDCFTIDVEKNISQADFIFAFYTSRLFKMERFILKWLVAKPSSDAQAKALALGKTDSFAAWSVEARTANQLLMCDYQSRTRSWLMTEPRNDSTGTRLYFGSAVASKRPDGRQDRGFGFGFRLLLGFHVLYARGLLKAAKAGL